MDPAEEKERVRLREGGRCEPDKRWSVSYHSGVSCPTSRDQSQSSPTFGDRNIK